MFSLTTNEIAQGLADEIENAMDDEIDNAMDEGTYDDWNDESEHKLRLKISKQQHHGILYRGLNDITDFDGGVFDICHCMWAIILS